MSTRLQPGRLDEGHRRRGGRDNDVRLGHRTLQVGLNGSGDAPAGERFGHALRRLGAPPPQDDALKIEHAGMRLGHFRRQRTGAQHRQAQASLAGQQTSAQRSGGGGSAQGQLGAIDHRHRHAVDAGKNVVQGRHGGLARRGIGRPYRDHLHTDQATGLPGRHDQERAAIARRVQVHARGGGDGFAQAQGQGVDQAVVRAQARHGGGIEGLQHGRRQAKGVGRRKCTSVRVGTRSHIQSYAWLNLLTW